MTTPSGLPPSTTSTAPWARLGSRLSASPTVVVGGTVTGVSYTVCAAFTRRTVDDTTSRGMSCGMMATPPRRAMVSAMRRPEIAVMLATTSGMVVPVPSAVDRSTSKRDVTSERRGTMKTSLYVRSCAGCRPLRNSTPEV